MVNPRFPHHLIIKRVMTDSEDKIVVNPETGEEQYKTVFESECGLRDMVRGLDIDSEVIKADYKLSIPKHTFIIQKGDFVVFTNNTNGEVKSGKIEEAKVFNLGANVWFNQNGNG